MSWSVLNDSSHVDRPPSSAGVGDSSRTNTQQKAAELKERPEHTARQSDMLPWQREEGGMCQEGVGRKKEEGGGGYNGVQCIMQLAAEDDEEGDDDIC